ncbi:MAG: phosphate signaling complex protein PhoU [Pseudomonadota bacterium]|nr:phosphate signaling complex protein PhoU [Pseudomonadota bacterium]
MERTAARYELELRRLEELIIEMGQHGIEQLGNALAALEDRRSEVATLVIEGDTREDAWEAEVDQLVMELIALRQPAASDLRHVTTAFKAALHLERIGDYAANVAKRSLILPADLRPRHLFTLPEMGRWTLNMLRDTLRAYQTLDLELAISTWRKDEMLDTLTGELLADLMAAMKTDSETVETGTHLMFIAKNLERIGDHATNVCELIHYRASGRPMPMAGPRHSTVIVRASRAQ